MVSLADGVRLVRERGKQMQASAEDGSMAAVIGLPDQKWGERVHAVVVLHDGAQTSQDEIIDWCKDKIAGYKRPRSASIIQESEMPRTATGKIQKYVLRQRKAAIVPQ